MYRRQIESALHDLQGDADVHSARKHLKHARALLRLLRPTLSTRVYEFENAAARDAARPLSSVRDATVLIATLEKLLKRSSAPRAQLQAEALLSALRKRERRIAAEQLSSGALMSIRRQLRKALARSRTRRIKQDDWSALRDGVRITYRSGRREFHKARRDASTEQLHAWRKQVKYLWHQLQTFEAIAPVAMIERCHRLSDLLGDNHDLDVLCTHLRRSTAVDKQLSSKLLNALASRRRKLQRSAFRLGDRVFASRPKAFANKLDGRWAKWA